MKRLIAGLALASTLTACASAEEAPSQQAAVSFLRAATAGDGETACSLLAPETRRELEQDEEKPCAEAVTGVDLPDTGEARHTDVYGAEARVQLVTDTVFVSRFRKGWLVIAAGCTPRKSKPYDCTVKGS